jgi:predicted ferric reductase
MRKKGRWSDLLPKEFGNSIYRGQLDPKGLGLILGLTLLTLFIWLVQGPSSLNDPFRILAKVSAFSALSFLCLNFLLSTRARRLEDLFGGLDRAYAAHCTIGRMTLFWMLMHPLALGLSRLEDVDGLVEIFVPGVNVFYSLGTLGLLLFLILLLLTIVYLLPYQRWLFSHKAMGAVLLLVTVHSMGSGSDIAAHLPLAVWTMILTAIALGAYLYTELLYRYLGPKTIMEVRSLQERESMTEVILAPRGAFDFRPGQFIFVNFDSVNGKESHPFSISGRTDIGLRLSIKKAGDLTSELGRKLQIGQKAVARGPYGRFGDKHTLWKGDVVWLAGGIGITPFLSMLQDEADKRSERRILLIWSYREHDELPYEKEVRSYLDRLPGLTFEHWHSKENGRISGKHISDMLGGVQQVVARRFFICGPKPMMKALSEQIAGLGVHPKNVIFEDFNLI